MKTMTYTTATEVLNKGNAKIQSIEDKAMSFGKTMIILVDGKHQYQVDLSGAQVLALRRKGLIK